MNNKNLSSKELYEQKKRDKISAKARLHKTRQVPKKARALLVWVVVIGVVVAIIWGIASIPKLPTTSQTGHIEESPVAHILDYPIQELIQRHMLEHADGDGDPGIIIQYNCQDFDCEPDLIENLTKLVQKYPANVYLAPNDYDGKIILTKEGSIKILETFDDHTIRDFIEQRGSDSEHGH